MDGPIEEDITMGGDSDEDDEDEETLKLKLAAIEAKLKLKKLQNAKAKERRADQESDTPMSGTRGRSGSVGPEYTRNSRIVKGNISAEPQKQQSRVLVPVSPVRRTRLPDPESPARVLLGIDKGIRASDVSLKRPANTRISASAGLQAITGSSVSASKPKSFSERISDSRIDLKETAAKRERIKNARSHGFGVSSHDPPTQQSSRHIPPPQFRLPRSAESQKGDDQSQKTLVPDSDDPSSLEPYTGFHLNKRHLDHSSLTRTMTGKELYSIPRLLKEVVSPEYDPPECESDYVVLGIVASKSSPLEHRTGATTKNSSDDHARSKFMVLKLTDLKWEMDLFLFDTGFDSFWKIAPGTVVAILNPGIMPPKDKATGAFSLKLVSADDTMLEIGTSKHLKFCSAIKSDGNQCTQWIDGRKTEVCEFHIALKVAKARKGRMEFNTMVGGGTKSSAGATRGQGRGGARGGRGRGRGGLLPEGKTYDAGLHETLYLAPRELGFSATRLLDDGDADINAWQRGMSRGEMARKREKAIAKERELAAKLGALGASAGSEYLRKSSTPAGAAVGSGNNPTSSAATLFEEPRTAKELGLLDNKASDVTFTATSKRKRYAADFAEPMGWGGARKSGLLFEDKYMRSRQATKDTADAGSSSTEGLKSAQRNTGDTSPKKKARFMLANKGLREPGRESLGDAISSQTVMEDDSDDDLEIV
jgi:minichromosome maintenance protein 10